MSAGPPRLEPQIAVVIPTCRRPALLRRCLEALLQQSLEPRAYEVIVVDDGRSDDTREVIDELAARDANAPRLRYLRPGDGAHGPAAARNVGWRASAANVIAFTDDDTVPDRDWLLEGLRALGPESVAASGQVVVPLDGPLTDHARNTQGLAAAEFVTANAFVRRAALAEIGGFDERFTRAWREDSDLQFTLMERCGTVTRAARAVVAHPVRPAPWGVSLSQQRNVSFDALLYRKHPRLYRARIRRRPPWHYVAIVGSALAALLAGLLGAPALALGLAALSLAGMLAFAVYRLRGSARTPAHVAEMLVTSCAIPFLALYWRAVGVWRFRVLFP
jgi:glycosyltransferase involved in cell wall biosynthesis